MNWLDSLSLHLTVSPFHFLHLLLRFHHFISFTSSVGFTISFPEPYGFIAKLLSLLTHSAEPIDIPFPYWTVNKDQPYSCMRQIDLLNRYSLPLPSRTMRVTLHWTDWTALDPSPRLIDPLATYSGTLYWWNSGNKDSLWMRLLRRVA